MQHSQRGQIGYKETSYAHSFAWLANNYPTAGNNPADLAAVDELVRFLNQTVDIQGLKVGGSYGTWMFPLSFQASNLKQSKRCFNVH